MQSSKQFSLKVLKEELKKFLKKYRNLEDIIIFGSFVKEKYEPNDIDIALLMHEKNYNIAQEIKKNLGSVPIHITVILFKELYTEPLWKNILAEGFSIKKNKYLKDIVNIKPVMIYSYQIDAMTPTEKTQFNRGLKEIMEVTGSFKTGSGSVIVPENRIGQMNDFFKTWSKAKKKVYKAILL